MKIFSIGFTVAFLAASLTYAGAEQTTDTTEAWEFTTSVEGIEFSLKVKGDSSAFFEALSIDSLRELVQAGEGIGSGSGGGMRTHVNRGVSVKSIRISCEATIDQVEIRESLENLLTNKLETDGIRIVGSGKSTGGVVTFSIYYESEYRYGGIHCTLLPSEGASTRLHFLVHESPLLDIGYPPDAEQIEGENSE